MKVLQLQPDEPVLLSALEPVSKKLRIWSFVFEYNEKAPSGDLSLTPRLEAWSKAPGNKAEAKSEKAREGGCQ